MKLNLDQKRQIVEEVAKVAASALSAVIADYRGLTVAELTALRVQGRERNIYVRVVRNTLVRRAVKDTPFECLKDALTGSLILLFSQDEPGAAAKLVRDFVKSHEKLQVKGIAINGQFLDAKSLSAVASLPTREEALSLLLAVMKAPVSKFVRTLAAPHAKLVRTIAAVRDKKQAA